MPTNEDAKVESPDTTSMAYDIMAPYWEKAGDVLGGTDSMRAAGSKHLPQHPAEDDDVYRERLMTNVLSNRSEQVLEQWVGKPFSKPIVPSEDMPESIQSMMENVDLLGNKLDVFARHWFSDGLAKAFSHVLVDFPNRVDEEGRVRSVADDIRDGVRPYWVHIPPENLIFARSAMRGGREVITHARIKESVMEPVGFWEKEVQRIRVWDAPGEGLPSTITIYEIRKNPKTGKEEWTVVDEYGFELDFVPLVTFYANRQGFMLGKSPLEGCLNLNITHWQSASDQRSTLTVTRFPMLGASGVDSVKELTIGPRTVLASTEASGKFYYIEHSGKTLEAGRQDMKDLEEQMADYGADLLRKRPGNATATARALDASEAQSPLQAMVLVFEDSLNLALQYTKAWTDKSGESVESAGTVTVNREFLPTEEDSTKISELREARKLGDIDRETYLSRLMEFEVLPDDFDMEKNKAGLEQETMDMPPAETEIEIDEGAEE